MAGELIIQKPNAIQKAILAVLNAWDRTLPWHKLPQWTVLPFIYLYFRRRMMRLNLVDVPQPPGTGTGDLPATLPDADRPLYRTADGYGNNGADAYAGTSGTTVGRNIQLIPPESRDSMGYPEPQLVAQKLLSRRAGAHTPYASGFRPAGLQLNIMAAAWIQAMIHDWQDHELDHSTTVTFADGAKHGCPLHKFKLEPTDNAAPQGSGGTAYLNPRTAWWDASFVYGQNAEAVAKARTFAGGKVRVDADMLPIDADGTVPVGDQMNSWAGVALLQDVFVREHNMIAEAIAAAEPELDDEGIFRKARLAVAAIVAKIHTIDWTVELLKTPLLKTAMNVNWNGFFGLGPNALGLVGAKKAEDYGVRFSLSEEFTSVYRLHPLLPDVVPLEGLGNKPTAKLLGTEGAAALKKDGTFLYWQSMLRYPCGALQLWNYPASMRSVPVTDEAGAVREDAGQVDLAAIDIFRDRERGVPRFNEFRRRFNLYPYKTWKEMTGGDEAAAAALEEVYGVDMEACDLLVGNLAEAKIPGFAISETSFLVFLLMASRRLETDRFLTEHYNEEVYGRTGFQWVKETSGLRDVLGRHFPDVVKELPPGESAFKPYAEMPLDAAA
eukprot:jgi/Ulvmu1/7862/UM004_0093.1